MFGTNGDNLNNKIFSSFVTNGDKKNHVEVANRDIRYGPKN